MEGPSGSPPSGVLDRVHSGEPAVGPDVRAAGAGGSGESER